jgi:hypothetical protein
MNPQDILPRLQSLDSVQDLRSLFIEVLNFGYRAQPLTPRTLLSAAVREPVRDLRIVAGHGDFVVILCTLDDLSKSAERPIALQLMSTYFHSLMVFTDPQRSAWHICTFKHVEREEDAEVIARRHRPFRRMVVGETERLRTISEQLAKIAPDAGDTALQVHLKVDEAFDVEAVTEAFFADYRRLFEIVEQRITGLDDADALRLFTQRLFNRLLFITFLERKGWLIVDGREDYLRALWDDHRAEVQRGEADANFYRDRLKLLFFAGLNNPSHVDIAGIAADGPVARRIGQVPYLNGGLFEPAPLDKREGIGVPDAVIGPILDDLIYRYNFTVTESTPLDVEVAVDPEMLGKIFEELVTGRHESGSYYTPKPVVAFMCREALKAYLRDTCPGEDVDGLARLVDAHDAGGLRNPEAVIGALQQVRACDPACGSGAYLVGMLHELMALRQAIFSSWGVDPRAVYEKKLEIIQHNLYGVDLDPFAVNIARLRLWLSLIVEFETDAEHPQPPPLPNLAYKIEVGDSLTAPAPAPLQPNLFHRQWIEEYFRLKGQFMTAHGPEKRALQEKIAEAKEKIAKWAGTAGDTDAFDWTVEFAEIFIGPGEGAATLTGGMTGVVNATAGQMQLAAQEGRDPGFDIIVANPPYVDHRLVSGEHKRIFKSIYPEVYRGNADLYVYFYARALQLLRKGGVASFISSNKWLKAGYGKKLRKYFKKQVCVESLIDFGDLPLFKATTYPMITVFRKAKMPTDQVFRALEIRDLKLVEQLVNCIAKTSWRQPQSTLNSSGWILLQPDERELLNKMIQNHDILENHPNVNIYSGIKTGFNKGLVIDQSTYRQIISQDPKSSELIEPWLRGRDIDPWSFEWGGEYLIAIRNSGDNGVNHPWSHGETEAATIFHAIYPAIFDYLERYKERLRARYDQGKFWWELRACSYYLEFQKPKMLWAKYGVKPRFSYDRSGHLCGNTVFILPTENLSLLGFLNSKVTQWFAQNKFNTVQSGYIEWIPASVAKLPIPTPTEAQRDAIETLVRQLLDVEGEGPQAREWERALNAHVYEVYDLTPAEIALIEEATAGSA